MRVRSRSRPPQCTFRLIRRMDILTFLRSHLLDAIVVFAYLAVVLYLGRAGAKTTGSQEGFFLANRSLGKLYQFFLNFGQSTDPQGAVSTASVVYQQGVSGVWLLLQSLFMNPYYWFMNLWFRRARLVTVADLFEDRLASRSLAVFYAAFQIFTAVVIVKGFSNFIAYKVTASLLVKPETAWSPAERQSVLDYQQMKRLEHEAKVAPLTTELKARLDRLHDADARGTLHSYITVLQPLPFYFAYVSFLGLYIVLGGMGATVRNEALQGSLMLVFSVMLIPVGLHAIGGWHQLALKVPPEMFDLFGNAASQVTGGTLLAILFVSIIQGHANINNMSVAGSARSEFAARFGAVSGTYAKRVMITLWAFTGLIAIALFSGLRALSDPDMTWGTMSGQLLGPGFLGLMLAGVLAGNMSTGAAHTMSISGLFVRNVHRYLRPNLSERQSVAAGRWAIVVSLALSIGSALAMTSAFSITQLFLLMNVPFGAAILMIFLWRRLTAPAVWTAVIMSALVTLAIPFAVAKIPLLAQQPALVKLAHTAPPAKPEPIFFESVVRARADDLASPLIGRGRFHAELFLLHLAGFDLANWPASARFAARFVVSGMLPFLFLIGVSLFTRGPPRDLVDRFYGKMQTPVGDTPELETSAVAATLANPRRLEHTKLFPNSSWELMKWRREDALGFFACCAISGAILGAFMLVLHSAAR
jgi:solute:Na+ symporter, SSS family